MGSIKHAKTSPVPNPLGDTRRVGGGDWNSEHIIDLEVADINGLEARLIPVEQVEQFRDDALAFRNEAAGSASDAAASAAEAADTVAGTVKKADLEAAATQPAYAFTADEMQSIMDGAVRRQSYTTLRSYTGRAENIRITVGGQAGLFYRDTADVSSADNGGTVIVDGSGRRWKRYYNGALDPRWFGAVRGAVSTAAIQAAINVVRASGRPGSIDFGADAFYLLDAPLKGTFNCQLEGSAILRATAGFASLTFDVFGGGTLVIAPMIYFVDTAPTIPGNAGTVDNPSGSRRKGLQIGKNIDLQGVNQAGFGVFLDNYIDYRIDCSISNVTKWGVWAYNSCWGGKIGSYITGPGEGGVWLRKASNGISLEHMKVWGEDKIPTVAGVLIDGDNNGISFAGTFIEKVTKGLICRNGCGPVDVTGIDFEKIEEETIYVDGTAVPSRISGPVTISSDFIETNSATHPLIYANNAIVIVRGSRLRNAAKAFEQIGNGHILSESNQIEATVLSIGTGRIIRKAIQGTRNWAEASYSAASNTLEVVREFPNYAYTYNPALQASGIQFLHSITDVPTQRMVGRFDLFVCDMQGGAEVNRMGLRGNYTGGGTNKQLTPLDDNATSMGSASNRLSVVFAGNGAINTSDEREKQDIEPIFDAVLDAWAEIDYAQYRWKDSVRAKGDDARTHFGLIAQKVKEVFERRGLDATHYGLLCYDAWDDEYEVVRDKDGHPIPVLDGEGNPKPLFDENGNKKKAINEAGEEVDAVEVQMRLTLAAGNRWGIRPDQCMFLEAALMRRRLKSLERAVPIDR